MESGQLCQVWRDVKWSKGDEWFVHDPLESDAVLCCQLMAHQTDYVYTVYILYYLLNPRCKIEDTKSIFVIHNKYLFYS